MLAPQREANLNGKNSFQQNFQFLYNAGVSRMLNYPNRKEGPTRAMIDGRFSNQPAKPKWQKKYQPAPKS